MKAEQKKKIISELEEMIGNQILESKEVDVSANEIFRKFIEPLLLLQESQKATSSKAYKNKE